MGQRITRVNELLRREISNQLHTVYQAESVYITITGVNTSPDLRNARIYYSVFGDTQKQREARRFLSRKKKELRYKVGDIIRLKYMPHFEFMIDTSIERGVRMIDYMDEVESEDDFEDDNNQDKHEE